MKTIKNELLQPLQTLSNKEYMALIISGVVGLCISILTSALVNAVLVEISISIIFSAYFGICFIIIGIIILMRIESSAYNNEQLKSQRPYLKFFGFLVVLSGLICFFLERDWRNQFFSPVEKIPLYIILGITLNLAINFSLLDIVNYLFGLFQKSWQRTMVETPNQIVCIFILSSILGIVYGFLFSAMDIEDVKNFYNLERKLNQEEYYCRPISALLGFLGGAINEFLRIKGNFAGFKFEQIHDPFQEEI